MATADICDCFYACDCPPGLEQYFGLSFDITAEEAHLVSRGGWDGDFSTSSTWTPCFKVLPMGFNWSFYLVQILHEQAAMEALGIDRSGVFLDGHPCPLYPSAIHLQCLIAIMSMFCLYLPMSAKKESRRSVTSWRAWVLCYTSTQVLPH